MLLYESLLLIKKRQNIGSIIGSHNIDIPLKKIL